MNDLNRFAALALACVTREFPFKVAHLMRGEEDALRRPRDLTPAFYGCFDWHSAVHGHWTLARFARLQPDARLAPRARAVLGQHLRAEHIAAEVDYIGVPERAGFERPYGLAWLLLLAAELADWDDPEAARWSAHLEPLERLAAARISSWLGRLTHPIRTGTHSQTAFALGLTWDWATRRGEDAMLGLIDRCARHFHLADRDAPLAYEPSGHDFLSPTLACADLMRRVLAPAAFSTWLEGYLPGLAEADGRWLEPVTPSDRADGHLTHLDGLNLSRAWMLEGIADALSEDDARRAFLLTVAHAHRARGLGALSGDVHYAGGHWLGSFALYLLTR